MEPSTSSNKRILIAGGILLVVILAIITAVLSNRRQPGQTQITPPSSTTQSTSNTGDMIAYKPPVTARYSALGDINFFPSKINSVTLNREKLLSQANLLFPNLSQQELITKTNQIIFSWLAINNFYASSEPTNVSTLYTSALRTNTLDNFSLLNSDYQKRLPAYNVHTIKLSGFFIKVRFANVRPENMIKLGKKQSELEPLAKSIIQHYYSDGQKFQQKDRLVDFINKDEQVILLNNGEQSQKFTDRDLFPPIVSDPAYYTWIQNLLVGQFSNIMSLKQFNAQSGSQQNYAYAFFYISKKDGNHLPLNILADQYIAKAAIQ